MLSLIAWGIVSHYLVGERESAALAQADLHRSLLASWIVLRTQPVALLLDGLATDGSIGAVGVVDGRWYSTSHRVQPDDLPSSLVAAAIDGETATQRIQLHDGLYLAVGMPLAQSADAFFEVFPLDQTQRTLRMLSWSLAATGGVTTVLGVMAGRFASRISLRPLTELNAAAGAVVEGRLDVRLPVGDDPDLTPLAESFNQTVGALQHRVMADARFTADVGHELRTPLTTMLNSVQVVRNRAGQLPEVVAEPLSLLEEELERFRALVVDLLEISRHDAGDQLVLAPAAIGHLVRLAADGATGRPVTTVETSAQQVTLLVDRRRLERAIANLVHNADSHGGGCAQVTVLARDGQVLIVVDDAGRGIPQESRALVFDRFARGPEGRTDDGVGLGLAIVQRHVSDHAGTVHVEERPGGGARFVIALPLTRP